MNQAWKRYEGERYRVFEAHRGADFDVYFDPNHATKADLIYRHDDSSVALYVDELELRVSGENEIVKNLRIAGQLERIAHQPSLRRVYVEEVRPFYVGEVRKSTLEDSMRDINGDWAVTYTLSFFGIDNTAGSKILVGLLRPLLPSDEFAFRASADGLIVDYVGEVGRPGDFFRRIEKTLRWQLAEMSEATCAHGNNCFECTEANCELPLLAVLMGSYAEMMA